MSITVRDPAADDRPDWERLYRDYAEFYGVPMNDEILATVWGWITDPDQAFHAIVAIDDERGGCVGLMHYRPMFSPLRGNMAGFLDDLYVDPAARGGGAVQALFRELGARGRQRDWPVIRWITRDNNYRARAVYDRVATRTDWVTYELTTR